MSNGEDLLLDLAYYFSVNIKHNYLIIQLKEIQVVWLFILAIEVNEGKKICEFCGSNTRPPDFRTEVDFSLALSQLS